jgi:hypothetical protein
VQVVRHGGSVTEGSPQTSPRVGGSPREISDSARCSLAVRRRPRGTYDVVIAMAARKAVYATMMAAISSMWATIRRWPSPSQKVALQLGIALAW